MDSPGFVDTVPASVVVSEDSPPGSLVAGGEVDGAAEFVDVTTE